MYGVFTELAKGPCMGTEVLESSQKLRVLWHGRTELTEVPGSYENAVPVPRVFWHGSAEVTDAAGTGINVIQNLERFRVPV